MSSYVAKPPSLFCKEEAQSYNNNDDDDKTALATDNIV